MCALNRGLECYVTGIHIHLPRNKELTMDLLLIMDTTMTLFRKQFEIDRGVQQSLGVFLGWANKCMQCGK